MTTKKKTTKKKTTKKKIVSKPAAKMGRPTDYRPKYCDMLIEHMGKGLSFETFGVEINQATSTTYKWLEKHEEFVEAKKIAESKCRAWWEKVGAGLATGNKSVKNGNSAVWIYNMKCRFPKQWRPKKELDISARYENDLRQLENMSTEQLAQLASAAAKYLKAKENDD